MTGNKIDVHHHVFPALYIDALKRIGVKLEGGGMAFPNWGLEAAIETMDRSGIRAAVVSFGSPGVWFGDAGAARELARLCNEYLAGLIKDHPTRFGAFACLPLPDVQGAVAEAAFALDILKCDGVNLL